MESGASGRSITAPRIMTPVLIAFPIIGVALPVLPLRVHRGASEQFQFNEWRST
jgi:hypothetical protein